MFLLGLLKSSAPDPLLNAVEKTPLVLWMVKPPRICQRLVRRLTAVNSRPWYALSSSSGMLLIRKSAEPTLAGSVTEYNVRRCPVSGLVIGAPFSTVIGV